MSQYYEPVRDMLQNENHGRYINQPQYAGYERANGASNQKIWERPNPPRQHKSEAKPIHRSDVFPKQNGMQNGGYEQHERQSQQYAAQMQYEDQKAHQYELQNKRRSNGGQDQYAQENMAMNPNTRERQNSGVQQKNSRRYQGEEEMYNGGGRREVQERAPQYQEQDTSQSDMGDENDLDEGTIVAQGKTLKKRSNKKVQQERQSYGGHQEYQEAPQQQNRQRTRSQQPMYDFEPQQVGHRGSMNQSMNVQAKRTSNHSSPQQQDPYQEAPAQVLYQEQDGELDEEWEEIQKKIDLEYQKKLKQVNDEAMNKLSLYQREHKEMIEKSQFIYSQKKPNSRVGSNGSHASRGSVHSGAQLNQQPTMQGQMLNRSANAGSRVDSRASNLTNLSFLSSNKGGSKNSGKDRNRFFSPRAIKDLPPQMNEAEQVQEHEEEDEERNETICIKKFYKEYCSIVKKNVSAECQIYLVDVLEQLHFLDDEAVNDNRMKLCAMLRQHKQNFMVYSKSGEYSGESEDIIKNLFKILCGIQNFRLKQRGHNGLDEKLLRTYCGAIRYTAEDPDFTVMDQLNTIKSLINRKAFSLSETQIGFLHQKFKNFYKQREEFKQAESKTKLGLAKQQQSLPKHFETPNPRLNELEEEERIRRQPMPQSHQPKAVRQDQYLLEEEEEERYSYKPVKTQQTKTTVLYSDVIGNSRNGYDNPRRTSNTANKRPWSGARPASRASRSSRNGSQSSFHGPDRNDYPMKQIGKSPKLEGHRQAAYEKPNPKPTQSAPETRPYGVTQSEWEARLRSMHQPVQPQALLQPKHESFRSSKQEDFQQYQEADRRGYERQRSSETRKQAEFHQNLQAREAERQSHASKQLNGPPGGRPADHKYARPDAEHDRVEPAMVNSSFGTGKQLHPSDPRYQHQHAGQAPNFPPAVEEPICVLKIELDGEHVEEIKVFKNDRPFELVQQFGKQFNLSDNAKQRLFEQIQEQILAEESERD